MKASDYITNLQHVGIPTDDLEKTVLFFTGLGFEVALRTVNAKAGERVCFLKLQNLCIEVYQIGNTAKKPGAIDHIALDVTDIEKTFETVKAGGYTLLDQEIQFLPFWNNGVRFFTILGPNGEKVEFSQML